MKESLITKSLGKPDCLTPFIRTRIVEEASLADMKAAREVKVASDQLE